MEKIKYFISSEQGKDILTILIIILVGFGSFGLGRLSKNNPKETFKLENSDISANVLKSIESPKLSNFKPNISQKNEVSINKNFFASSRGKKYYPVGCSAGNSLSEANKIWFSTGEEAQQAGYELSKSC